MCVKTCAFSPENIQKGRNFTYLEDPGVYQHLQRNAKWFLTVLFFFFFRGPTLASFLSVFSRSFVFGWVGIGWKGGENLKHADASAGPRDAPPVS